MSSICIGVWRVSKLKLSKKKQIVGEISLLVIVCYTATSVINRISCVEPLKALLYVQGLVTAMCVVALFAFVTVLPVEKEKKGTLLLILVCICCMVAPLLIVSPLGSRCFFPTYVMLIYFTLEMYSCIDKETKVQVTQFQKYMGAGAMVGVLFLFYIFGTIYKNQNERVEKAQADAMSGKTTIEVQVIPYHHYTWNSSPSIDPFVEERFKEFYGINHKIRIESVPHH